MIGDLRRNIATIYLKIVQIYVPEQTILYFFLQNLSESMFLARNSQTKASEFSQESHIHMFYIYSSLFILSYQQFYVILAMCYQHSCVTSWHYLSSKAFAGLICNMLRISLHFTPHVGLEIGRTTNIWQILV